MWGKSDKHSDTIGENASDTNIAELSDFVVAPALGIKVTATLATTHHQARQRVLEDLLKAKELEDRQIHGGVEPKSTLVRAESRVELDNQPPSSG